MRRSKRSRSRSRSSAVVQATSILNSRNKSTNDTIIVGENRVKTNVPNEGRNLECSNGVLLNQNGHEQKQFTEEESLHCGKLETDCGRGVSCRSKVKFTSDGRSKRSCSSGNCLIVHATNKKRRVARDKIFSYSKESFDVIVNRPPMPTITKIFGHGKMSKKATMSNKGSARATSSAAETNEEIALSRYCASDLVLLNGRQPADYLLQRTRPQVQLTPQGHHAQAKPLLSAAATIQTKISHHKRDDPHIESQLPEVDPIVKGQAFLHGLPIPTSPPRNLCAECGTLDSAKNVSEDAPVVLLCDGPRCGREYHMSCCNPSLARVPSGDWYCCDCSEGTTPILRSYFKACDVARAKFASPQLYQAALRQQDCQRVTMTKTQPGQSHELRSSKSSTDECNNSGGSTRRKSRSDQLKKGADSSSFFSCHNVISTATAAPPSELQIERLVKIHFAALADPNYVMKSNTVGIADNSSKCLGPDFLVGKSVRLYEPTSEQYHTGRIVDYKEQMREQLPKQQIETYQYLVRFLAGMEGRKQNFHHWIYLEEHDLSVGTTLVWASIQSVWQPCLVWLRTSRSIMFQESARVSTSSGNSGACDNTASRRRQIGQYGDYQRPVYHTSHPSLRREKLMAWIKPLDPNSNYTWIDVKSLAVEFDISSPTTCFSTFDYPQAINGQTRLEKHLTACKNSNDRRRLEMLSLAAFAELNEQARVRKWHLLFDNEGASCQSKKSFFSYLPKKLLASRDEYCLEPLLIETENKRFFDDKLRTQQRTVLASKMPSGTMSIKIDECPLLSKGIDRFYLLDLLQHDGIQSKKCIAMSLSCRFLNISTHHESEQASQR